jgi:hypothetical protein
LKDPYTRAHSERVGILAALVACELGAPATRVDAVRLGGTLHDIGKLAVPTEVLRKNGPLTDEERCVVQLHPADGDSVLRGISVLGEARAAVLHHHERIDGTGYPYGLSGGRIPEAARIVAVADAFDAMTSTRSYRSARPAAPALAELRRCAGTQFDPMMVEALARALAKQPWPESGACTAGAGAGAYGVGAYGAEAKAADGHAAHRCAADGGGPAAGTGPSVSGAGPAAFGAGQPPAGANPAGRRAGLCGATTAVEGTLLARVPAHPPTWAWLDAGAKGKGVG